MGCTCEQKVDPPDFALPEQNASRGKGRHGPWIARFDRGEARMTQNDYPGSSGYAGRESELREGEQDDRDAWGEYPGQFGGEYDDAERRFGPRSSYPPRSPRPYASDERGYAAAQRDYAAGYPAPPRRAYAGPNRRRSFRGRGPRGYTRSDERIREDVCDRLTEEDVDVSDVEVRVTKGEVTLSGSVPDRATKREVEGIAERVSGVTDIANQLRVRREGESRETETKPREAAERPKAE
jgi:hypothetical protein